MLEKCTMLGKCIMYNVGKMCICMKKLQGMEARHCKVKHVRFPNWQDGFADMVRTRNLPCPIFLDPGEKDLASRKVDARIKISKYILHCKSSAIITPEIWQSIKQTFCSKVFATICLFSFLYQFSNLKDWNISTRFANFLHGSVSVYHLKCLQHQILAQQSPK